MITARKSTIIRLLIAVFFLTAVFSESLVFAKGTEVRLRGGEYGKPLVGGKVQAEYFLSVGDVLKIFILKNPDLSGSATISSDGKISYPLIGEVMAAGLTVSQFQQALKEKFSAYIRYPEVTVTIEASAGKKIVVVGEVDYPGVYSYEGEISIIEAIALAGDVTRDAKRESIIVVSDNFTDTPTSRRVNLFKALREGSSATNLLLQAGDVVYVPRQFIADVAQCGRNLSAIMAGSDSVTNGLIDWRHELRRLYNQKINSRGNKAYEKDEH